ncbi:MAG: SMC-Scp complex subunit ScpB [Nitrospiraceae bacterium]|nr:SMC-Scp complex subunit ScpB [Nitrospiraceae bacterium]
MMEINKKASIEALLFVAGEPLRIQDIKDATGLAETEITDILDELRAEYRERSAGMLVSGIAGGFQMHTNPEHSEWARKLRAAPPQKLSPASLETLAIIAYKQPITKAEVDVLRGVNSDGVFKTLLDRRFVKIVGRKEAPGKPLLYGTTQEFLMHFGLKDLTELPTLKELERGEAV